MSFAEEGRAPGMHDVARRAGVSHQTVSRVLNGLPNVRQETKETITVPSFGTDDNVGNTALAAPFPAIIAAGITSSQNSVHRRSS